MNAKQATSTVVYMPSFPRFLRAIPGAMVHENAAIGLETKPRISGNKAARMNERLYDSLYFPAIVRMDVAIDAPKRGEEVEHVNAVSTRISNVRRVLVAAIAAVGITAMSLLTAHVAMSQSEQPRINADLRICLDDNADYAEYQETTDGNVSVSKAEYARLLNR